MSKVKRHLFNLPDGATLKFAPHFWPGPLSKWFMSFDDERVWIASHLEKKKQYRLNLWSSSTDLYLLVGDFDFLPPGYADFNSLAEYLKKFFSSSEAIICRSASNKLKIFFLVQTPPNVEMTRDIAIETLSKIFTFDIDLFYSIDLSTTALKITYLNYDVLNALSADLSKLVPMLCVLQADYRGEDVLNTSTTKDNTGAKHYRSYEGEIPPLLKSHDLNKCQEDVLRIILEAKQLITPFGFCFSTLKTSKKLNVSSQIISRYRKEFEKKGWLKILGPRFYVPGKRALRFTASGDLELVMRDMYSIKLIIPEVIADGSWHETLFRLISYLQKHYSLEQALSIVSKIKGSQENGRMKKAENLYLWFEKIRSPSRSKKSAIKSNITIANDDLSPNFQRNCITPVLGMSQEQNGKTTPGIKNLSNRSPK